ncbi:lysophospholipid acyltransferase family protein [Iodidimonas gelatinilytica]|uniref:lysophospholipid acyltransferase family protein n=1 Tax=Iodidimonas gelatinilytica TaxID=1236966 RepID=UPI0012311FA7|nr:1-acyl-sn-glycerol-3-phosphate acyltransferase [Iodidimonas gelatinilytica]
MRSLRELRGTLGFHLGAASALGLIVLSCALVVPFQLFVLRFMPRHWLGFPMGLSRFITRLVGVETEIRGQQADGPVLFVSNHISWLDIPIIGGHVKAAFIAKKEVAGWGGISLMARLYRSVFVDRGRPRSSIHQRNEISARLAEGDSLILFAEGTSTDGTMVKPFKSSLFSVAQGMDGLKIQPSPLPIPISTGFRYHGRKDR